MKNIFEGAAIILCILAVVWLLGSPQEISGKDIAGGTCCTETRDGPRCGGVTPSCIFAGCTACPWIEGSAHPCEEGGRDCTGYCTKTQNCIEYTCNMAENCVPN